jgi:hypothetical protein
MEGFALLRDRLREANGNNRDFDSQYGRLLEVLQTILLRLVNGCKDQIEQVLAIGEWAESGTDLRNSPTMISYSTSCFAPRIARLTFTGS